MISDHILIAASPVKTEAELTRHQLLVCGSLADMVSRTICAPLDIIKLFAQVDSSRTGAWQHMQNIWKQGGISAFWRGNAMACINSVPLSALKSLFQGEAYKILRRKNKSLTNIERLLVGSVTGLMAQTIVYPLDVIRTRLTVNPAKYSGIFSTAATILREEGFTGLFSGYIPMAIGAIPYESGQFYAYDFLVDKYGKELTTPRSALFGVIAASFGQTIAYPFDLLRKRQMTSEKPMNIIQCAKEVYKTGGPFAFFKGMSINFVKLLPYNALHYAISYETKKFFYLMNSMQSKSSQKTK